MSDGLCVWWNVERFFGVDNNQASLALEGATARTKQWHQNKANAIASGLVAACNGELPWLLGLCEVESSTEVRAILKAAGWSNKLKEAKDPSPPYLVGYDVTLLYRPDIFRLAGSPISHNVHHRFATRDLFEVALQHKGTGEELLVLANHWPSRLQSGSPSMRIALADRVKLLINQSTVMQFDELKDSRGRARLPARKALHQRWNRKILVMGDLNDEPSDVSVRTFMDARKRTSDVTKMPRFPSQRGIAGIIKYLKMRPKLYNPSWSMMTGPVPGTATFGGKWYCLDQLLLSAGLLTGPLSYVSDSLRVFDASTVPNLNGGKDLTVRTKHGNPKRFNGKNGISDHLLIVWKLTST